MKRVWILGAGFSRPLGGPLLRDLLSMRSWRKHSYLFKEFFDRDDVKDLYLLFAWGTGYPDGTVFGKPIARPGCKQFVDAEDFLLQIQDMEDLELRDMIMLAHKRTFGGASARSRQAPMPGKEEYIRLAHRILALECSTFTRPIEEGDERFTPYTRWVQKLTSDDAIITYNYDLVAEQLLREESNLIGVVPETAPRGRKIPVCKMHGSCNWFEQDSGVGVGLTDDAADQEKPAPVLGIPGKSKTSLGKRHQCFTTIETRAHQLLRDATHVYIMGYGLPESDANASRFLLGSLRHNTNPDLSIEVILGEPNFRTQRLEATLRQALAHRVHSEDERRRYRDDLEASQLREANLGKEREARSRGDDLFFRGTLIVPARDEVLLDQLLKQERATSQELVGNFKDMTLTVRPQYAQDYMQGFATHGGSLEPHTIPS